MDRRTIAIIAGLIVLAGILGWVLLAPEQSARSSGLTEITEPFAIQKIVQISNIGIATGENFVGHKVRYVIGILKNVTPDKPVRMVEVKFVFTDYDGNPVQQHRNKIYEATIRPLAPGSQYEFQIGFENLPRNWNYRRPQAQIVRVAY